MVFYLIICIMAPNEPQSAAYRVWNDCWRDLFLIQSQIIFFFFCWQKRDGSFTWKSLWRMRNECLCPAASWRCYDCDVKAIKEILQFSLNNLTQGKIKEPFGVNIRQNWASSVTRLLWFVRDRSEYLSLSDSLIISRHTVHNLVRYRSTCNDTLRFQADLNWTCHDQNLVFLHFFMIKV